MKYWFPGIGALVVLGGIWFGWAAWRAHRQIVSLDVREMPMGEVLRKIEWQTWTKIRAEQALDGTRITLNVTDKPLSNVLDRIAEQAGAHWSTLYAVYDSRRALHALEGALSGNGKLRSAGWTILAPDLADSTKGSAPDQDGKAFQFHQKAGPDGPAPHPGRRTFVRRKRNGSVVFSGGAGGKTDVWTPTELLIPTALRVQFHGQTNQDATAQAAASTARKVHGSWTTYFAFSKSSLGVGFGPTPRPGLDPLVPNPNDRFARLTPEQRVQRERNRMGLNAR